MNQIGRVGNTEKWIQNEMYLVFLPSSCNSLRYIIFPILKDDTILFPEKKTQFAKLLTLPIQCFKKKILWLWKKINDAKSSTNCSLYYLVKNVLHQIIMKIQR